MYDRMKLKYIGKDYVGLTHGKMYEVLSIEKGWYRIMTDIDESYLFPPKVFEGGDSFMRRLDIYWYLNKEWWHFDEDGVMVINDDAPEEAKESYKHYLEQVKDGTD